MSKKLDLKKEETIEQEFDRGFDWASCQVDLSREDMLEQLKEDVKPLLEKKRSATIQEVKERRIILIKGNAIIYDKKVSKIGCEETHLGDDLIILDIMENTANYERNRIKKRLGKIPK